MSSNRLKIWKPNTNLTFLENVEVRTFESSNYILKQSKPFLHDDVKELVLNNEKFSEVYRGSENPILIDSLHQAKFTCSFDYSWYPFDQQQCSFYILLVDSAAKLRATNISYQGSGIMGQFQVHEDNWKIECDNSTRVEVHNHHNYSL